MPSHKGAQDAVTFLTENLVLVRIFGGIRTVQRARKSLGPAYVQALDGVYVFRRYFNGYEVGRIKALSEFNWNANEHGRPRAEQRAKEKALAKSQTQNAAAANAAD